MRTRPTAQAARRLAGHVAAALLLVGAPAASLPAQETAAMQAPGEYLLDGIAATVNEEIVTIGEVRRAALLARESESGVGALCLGQPLPAGELAAGRTPAVLGVEPLQGEPAREELAAALECLIDTRLVFREVRRFPRVAADMDVDAMVRRLREEFADRAAYEAELDRLAITEAEVRQDLQRQLLVRDYIDNRFRATVDISDEAARAAWDEEIAPDMAARGIEVPPFQAAKDDYVIPILREREVNRRVQSWIRDLRERSTIRRMYP